MFICAGESTCVPLPVYSQPRWQWLKTVGLSSLPFPLLRKQRICAASIQSLFSFRIKGLSSESHTRRKQQNTGLKWLWQSKHCDDIRCCQGRFLNPPPQIKMYANTRRQVAILWCRQSFWSSFRIWMCINMKQWNIWIWKHQFSIFSRISAQVWCVWGNIILLKQR